MPSLPRLSVVMFTNGPAALVAASLRRVRSIAHEIVVAVDDRMPVEDLAPIQAASDRVVRAEFVAPLEANLRWLHEQATGDWVLRLDSDDVVSGGLVRRLSMPGWDVGITHAYVQYRWLWGSPATMLDQAPWWPDPALRLIRNLPGIATFPTEAHQAPQVAGAARFWDEPLYHLDLILNDEDRRRQKVVGYEQQHPGHRTDRGWSVSSTYYLPERLQPPPALVRVPAGDLAVIEQVIDAGRSVREPLRPVDASVLRRVATAADRRPAPPVPGDSRLRVLDHDPVTVVAARSTVVTVGVTNLSAHTWDPGDDPPHVVGGRFFDADDAQVGPELRAALPGPLAPADETLVRVALPAGLPPAAVRLEVGMVQDGVAWHDQTATIGLHPTRGRRVLLSTGVSSFPHLGDDLITHEVLGAMAHHLPDVVPVLLAHPTSGLADRFGCEVVAGPASLPASGSRAIESGRRTRDLVNQARLMARGEPPADPQVRAILEPFAQAAALVLAPGGGLASRYSDDALMVCAVQALIARGFGLPVLVEGPSIGPIEVRRDHAALAELLNDAERITVRDRSSADAARRIGRAIDPVVVADPATAALEHVAGGVAAASAWLRSQNVPDDRPYAVVSLRGGTKDERHMDTVRRATEALPEGTALIYLPHCTDQPGHDDLDLLADPWAGSHLVAWDAGLGSRAAVGLVSGSAMTIGSRFHLGVLAAAAGVRALTLVADEYDRLRARGATGLPGMRVVELDEPELAFAAVTDLQAGPDPEPIERWDGRGFAEALSAVLPPVPVVR